jgi:hypothetical protein
MSKLVAYTTASVKSLLVDWSHQPESALGIIPPVHAEIKVAQI